MPNKDKLAVEIDDFDLNTLKKMAEEDGYDNLEDYVWVLIQDQIQRRNETEIIVSLPDFILQKLDEEVKAVLNRPRLLCRTPAFLSFSV